MDEIKITNIRVELANIPVDKLKVHKAMADTYLRLVQGAFGQFGEFRESPWAPLSPKYAKRVKRSYATLYVSGRLFNSISSSADQQAGHVISDGVPYNWVHQQGGGNNIPRRPFFPFDRAGNPTPTAIEAVTNAAKKALS